MERPNDAVLDELEQQHEREDAQEACRSALSHPRPLRKLLPAGGRLPESDSWLARFYANGRFAQEKKPGVFDHVRSYGPWFVSVDEDPLSVLDAMGQTATVCGGFAEDRIVSGLVEGEFGDAGLRSADTTSGHPAADEFAEVLRAQLPDLPHVTFTNAGAEANEKALALSLAACRRDAKRVIAFEGSFHGRCLLALHATWNPAKREPFQMAGHEFAFVPYPVWETPNEAEPVPPQGFYEAASRADAEELASFADVDPLLDREIEALIQVNCHIDDGDVFAVLVEPMQSEGGDRYASARFFVALRLLTRAREVDLIFDEVQTGFGLGGPFFWHQTFDLVDQQGRPDFPDSVTMAKRAQVGVVMSRYADPEPTHAHPASLVRGRLHAEMVADQSGAVVIEGLVRPGLQQVARDFPELVSFPRSRGYAFAFDVPNPKILKRYLAQRFWRGAIVFAAGKTTVRYRLTTGFDEREVRRLFASIRQTLGWLRDNPDADPPAWKDEDIPALPGDTAEPPHVSYRLASPNERDVLMAAITAIEARVYEPARQDDPEHLARAFDTDGIAIVAEVDTDGQARLVGSALGAPLEAFDYVSGIPQAPMFGENNTLYSIAVTVDDEFQGYGIGRELKRRQLLAARDTTTESGEPRYLYVTGRNRVGYTRAMRSLNTSLGAHEVAVHENQYGGDGVALYYRIPLQAPVPPVAPTITRDREWTNLRSGIADPFAVTPPSLVAAERKGLLAGPMATKITICNYITPAVVRAVEAVTALIPSLPHLYLTSGRDETVDKAVRTLRYHRPNASVAIGLSGGYVGHTTAAARSISDPEVVAQAPPYFGWPRVAHPGRDPEAATSQLDEIVAGIGADTVLGVFVEVVQERSGRTIPPQWWSRLEDFRQRTGVPVVAVETASAMYRTGEPFALSAVDFEPDVVIWWGGGQTGFVHMKPQWFIDKPLMMVSTWDGDELSLIRIAHQLRAARRLDTSTQRAWLSEFASELTQAGLPTFSGGLHTVVHADARTAELKSALDEAQIAVGQHPGGRLVIAPPLDIEATELERAANVIRKQL